MSTSKAFEQLIDRYISGEISDEEKALLLEALLIQENIDLLRKKIAEWYSRDPGREEWNYDEDKVNRIIAGILKGANESPDSLPAERSGVIVNFSEMFNDGSDRLLVAPESRTKRLGKRWFGYAAAIAVIIGTVVLYYAFREEVPETHEIAQTELPAEDVLPGSDRAILTLSNGQKVELSSSGRQVIKDGDISIQNVDGSLVYSNADEATINTMTTPRGGQYKLKLPDGTMVWLNASSSISYPTAFKGNTREVSMTGEAYFEVSKNPAKPFIVKTFRDEIRVTGTSFNVNSYTDEDDIKTSLLEGMVEINGVRLSPGKAYIGGKVINTDIEKDVAWKNGAFYFHQVKLKEAMRQIARWYDIEVNYEANVSEMELRGEIGRNLTLQQVLDGLQDKYLHFRLEGRKLIVY
ncbi:MAG: FecR family protein [Chitinophagaceae bacterium]|nr:FecR family protein [Chitinophagaceae bacterium]